MYIRIKSRKNSTGKINKYAYLVSSKRRRKSKKHPKQKVLAYLGRVVELNNPQQSSTILNNENDISRAIMILFKELLISNGFKPLKGLSFQKDQIVIDLLNKEVKDAETNKIICLKVNEGHIASHSLKKILPYKPPEATEKEVGLDFAKKLVSAGLKPSEEVFLALYSMISKKFHGK